MTWNTGPMLQTGGAAYVSDFDGTVLRIADADVRADEAERVREQWQRKTHPYEPQYPSYPCAKCGLWPGAAVHEQVSVRQAPQRTAGCTDPDR